MNLPTILVSAVLLAIVAAVIAYLYRERKRGGCCGGCAGCGGKNGCCGAHAPAKPRKGT